MEKRKFGRLTATGIIKAFDQGRYWVDEDEGEVYSGKTGELLSRYYASVDTEELYPFVTIQYNGDRGKTTLSRVIWIVTRRRAIPDLCEIHHIDENPHNNRPENLICIHKDDHARLHRMLKMIRGELEDELADTPF